MTTTVPKIDPRNKPLRGVAAIANYIGEGEQITRRMLVKGLIDADRDGKIWISTPARIDASFAGAGRAEVA
jgi:hypothetical protein